MKKIIILFNTALAFALITGCTSRVEENIIPMDTTITHIEPAKAENNADKVNYNIIKEDNAAVKKAAKEEAERKAEEERKAKEEAERLAREEAERKAAEEAARAEAQKAEQNNSNTGNQGNNNTNKQENNEISNNVSNNTSSGRSETTTVRGIEVYISNSVSRSDYDRFIGWVNNMPSFLLKHVTHIKVVDNISYYNPTGADASGLANGDKIYIKASGVSGRLGSLYHEAAHILDRHNGYSETSTWKSICYAEWGGEGHYSTPLESFAEAVSRYYVDGLSKSQSKTAIKNLVNTGNLGSNGDGFSSTNRTLYGHGRSIWLYGSPSDRVSCEVMVPCGVDVTAIGVNSDGSWYKVSYEGGTYYTPAYLVYLEP